MSRGYKGNKKILPATCPPSAALQALTGGSAALRARPSCRAERGGRGGTYVILETTNREL
ncbi:MAG: hypothetical protein DRG73_07725 [Deltaproteobacteria bacterium]|nr:MAG: hypothetical protein DRG73_07725 [Deltaproteobacteria bacterium]